MNKNSLENKSGITLIALIITIIVLLILAGVSIVSLRGENGLINQVFNAKNNTDDAQIKEEVTQAWYMVQNDNVGNNYSNSKIAYYVRDLLSVDDRDARVTYNENKNVFEAFYKGKNIEITTLG